MKSKSTLVQFLGSGFLTFFRKITKIIPEGMKFYPEKRILLIYRQKLFDLIPRKGE